MEHLTGKQIHGDREMRYSDCFVYRVDRETIEVICSDRKQKMFEKLSRRQPLRVWLFIYKGQVFKSAPVCSGAIAANELLELRAAIVSPKRKISVMP